MGSIITQLATDNPIEPYASFTCRLRTEPFVSAAFCNAPTVVNPASANSMLSAWMFRSVRCSESLRDSSQFQPPVNVFAPNNTAVDVANTRCPVLAHCGASELLSSSCLPQMYCAMNIGTIV